MTFWFPLLLFLRTAAVLASAKQALRYRITEEGPADVRIGNVAADLGIVAGSGEVTFSLESGSEYFKIDNITGELSTTGRRTDREKLPQCQMIFDENECFIDFEVSVIGPAQSWVDLYDGRVVVEDINDNTPSFPSPVLTLTVEENRPVGTLYLLPTATDRDFGTNGIERYELLVPEDSSGEGARRNPSPEAQARGAGSSVFELQVADTPDGDKQPQLIVKGALDRERRDSYELSLRVRDGGDPPRSSSALLRVLISDVNDNSPRFERGLYEAELAENSPPGTPVLQLRASDLDAGVNGQIEYGFGAATEAVRRLLRLDESTGRLSVLHRPDREELSQLRFTVTAKDRGQPARTDRATVSLRVRDQNDNAPRVDIRKIGRIVLRDGVAQVAEDVLVDTPVALVQVSDRDQGENGAVTCTVVGDVPFQLRPAGGGDGEAADGEQRARKYFLHTSAPLDYEAARQYTVAIVAVDSGSPSLSGNNSLLVRVTDVNDNPPVFPQPLVRVSVAENNRPGEPVASVRASDADDGKNAEVAYSLEPSSGGGGGGGGGGAAAGLFSIDPLKGDIVANAVLDREQTERYEFKVVARDKGSPSLQGSATVLLQVTDTNDNEPRFMQDVFTFYVKENLPPHSPVGMVTVMDADQGSNAELSLLVEEDGGIFSIDNDTGTIYSTVSFNREQQTTYSFKVKAVDGGEPPRSSTAKVSLYVMDENDNAPTITFPKNASYTLLPPSSNLRTVVATVLATDRDTGINADLNYSIVGGNPFKLFEIDSASGVISLVGKLTQKHYGLHRLIVQVNDSGQPSQYTTAMVHVFVNESVSNATIVEAQIARSLRTSLKQDIAGDPNYEMSKQRLSIVIGVVAGVMTVILIILVVVLARYCRPKKSKNGYEAGKKDPEDFFTPQQHDKSKKPKKDKKNKKSKQPLYSSIVTVEASKPNGQRYDSVNEKLTESPGMGRYRSMNGGPGSPDLGRHYKSSSPLPTVQLHPQSPTAGKKHQAVQELPPANTFVGTGDNISIESDHCSEYSCQINNKYNKQPFRRVTFSVVSQPQDPHQGSLQSCYDSGLEESETPSSKSSSGPRLGSLPLPEDNYERTTPDGSVGEAEHMENDSRPLPDVALTGKCTRECDELGHSDSCWMPVRTSPERRKKNPPKLSTFMPVADRGSQEKLANGAPQIIGDRNRNLLNKRLTSSYENFNTASYAKNEEGNPEDIPLTQTSDFKPSSVSQLTRREVYL
ncbi:protocadherin-7b isoform X1 [Stegostoma tigrinum]|uniref:protocadherin-7b isoform X1 n=1 Tax=Stegostoma tigrinum TaxID=3053191 RepID=UPI0028705261|nr:protocadherin-7b isoform X1 [Stegostoma tigrinum]